jgi:predicted lipoprotein with Yx(FWY)xxD motif
MRTTTYLVLAALLVAGCAGSDDPAAGDAAADGGTAATTTADAPLLATADTDLGEIVVDADGRTVYVFDSDTAGAGESSCAGPCLEQWPPVVADDPEPAVEGVTGEVGAIERDDGTLQVTLAGLPLYLFAGDATAGDTTGQAVNDVWWVVAPDGGKITAAADEPDPAPDYAY